MLARKLSEHPSAPEPALRKVMDRLRENNEEVTRDEPAFSGDLPLGFLSPSDKPEQLGLLGRYEVLEEIGRGGMGVVLKAFDPSLHRVVAIKVLAPQLATSGVARKRFLREAKAAAAVTPRSHRHHPRRGRGQRLAVPGDAVHRRPIAARAHRQGGARSN